MVVSHSKQERLLNEGEGEGVGQFAVSSYEALLRGLAAAGMPEPLGAKQSVLPFHLAD